jgi:PhnB protein
MKRAIKKSKRIANPGALAQQLDKAVGKIMSDRESKPPRVSARIAAILRVASDLRDLPSEDFKARLKRDLIARVTPAAVASGKANYIPAGLHTANACLVVRDLPSAIEFYKEAFGATELMRLNDPSGNIIHAQIKIGDSPIDIAPEQGSYNRSPQSLGGTSVPIGLYVEDVDALAEKAIAAGAKVIFPIADQFYGDRGGRLEDPFGHMWIVSTHKEDIAPDEMASRAEAWMQQMQASVPSKPAVEIAGAPEGYHSITPYLQVKGAAKLIEFLRDAFGAEEIFRVPRGDQIAHAQLRIEDSMIEVADAIDQYEPNPSAIWLHVKNTDTTYARALKAGASSLHEPMDQDYGERSAGVKDPFGNYWYIATHDAHTGAVPKELHSITPYLHPKSAPPVIDFLKRAFDAEEIERHQDPQGTVHHAKIRVGDSVIAMGEAHGPYQPMPPALHLYVPDTDATYKRALDAGAISIDEPADAGYGDRYAGVKDPFGNVWYIATHLRDFTIPAQQQPREIEPRQRPGSIMPFMFNDDPQAAFELYRKIFGAREIHRVTLPNGKPSHIQMAIGETHVMLDDATAPHAAEYRAKGFAGTPRDFGGTPLHLYIYVADADAAFKRALESGSKIVDAMADKEWGDRCGGVQDPFGHIWYIASPLKNALH